jgi:hypothetical protein
LETLRNTVQQDNECEVAFILIAYAPWHEPSSILGFCFCRRTWCNHLLLDFAAAHPNAITPAGGHIKGVGSAMIYSLVALARELGITTVWGEATQNSVGFYRHVLGLPNILDSFFIEDQVFENCLYEFGLVKTNWFLFGKDDNLIMVRREITWEELLELEAKYPFSAGALPARPVRPTPRGRKQSAATRTSRRKRS